MTGRGYFIPAVHGGRMHELVTERQEQGMRQSLSVQADALNSRWSLVLCRKGKTIWMKTVLVQYWGDKKFKIIARKDLSV